MGIEGYLDRAQELISPYKRQYELLEQRGVRDTRVLLVFILSAIVFLLNLQLHNEGYLTT